MTKSDPNRVPASLARDRVTVDLKTVDVGFLAALYLKGDKAALASFDEEQLVDLFEQACDMFEPAPRTPASARRTRSNGCETNACSRASTARGSSTPATTP